MVEYFYKFTLKIAIVNSLQNCLCGLQNWDGIEIIGVNINHITKPPFITIGHISECFC